MRKLIADALLRIRIAWRAAIEDAALRVRIAWKEAVLRRLRAVRRHVAGNHCN